MPEELNIIEPTLNSESGHCYSFVTSLCMAAQGHPLRLWVGRGVRFGRAMDGIKVVNHFSRRFRKVQLFFLYRRLLLKPGRIFIATAGRIDLILLDLATRGSIPPGKVYLYFHWFRDAPGKRERLKKISSRHPNLVVLGPTPSVISAFRECGFLHTEVVPYPISQLVQADHKGTFQFRHLLFAGAARQDKGFGKVVNLVEYLAQKGEQIPLLLQCSAEHYEKIDAVTRKDLDRLRQIDYPHLQTIPETLASDRYASIFKGGICLQPYDVMDFADRISGVTLDALSAGCPIITLSGTWMARVVERFDAGLVIEDPSPPSLYEAVRNIIANYERFQENALCGGNTLQKENNAAHLIRILTRSK